MRQLIIACFMIANLLACVAIFSGVTGIKTSIENNGEIKWEYAIPIMIGFSTLYTIASLELEEK